MHLNTIFVMTIIPSSDIVLLTGSLPNFTVSDLRLAQPGGPGPCIYIPQEEGAPVLPPGTGFPFGYLLRLRTMVEVFDPPPQRMFLCFKVKVTL
jgi:hypothetical protein